MAQLQMNTSLLSIPASRLGGVRAALAILVCLWGGVSLPAAAAEDLTSPSYRHRAGTFSASVATGLTSTASLSEVGESSASVGSSFSVTPAGSAATLTSLLRGFWVIAAGTFPSLDLDGDLAQFFLDEDDDGDGLLDVHETGTGIFVSALNTGSSPVAADSDGDGFSDGAEVAEGTDPNDEQSFPAPNPAVPSLSPGSLSLLLILLLFVAAQSAAFVRRKSRRRTT
ncbi:MAG: thrombospondin type 3 repeat-containing protein [Myxococcota bacterium]